MEQELILTVGLPRSGKTTWAKKQGCQVVNPDSIRLAVHGNRFLMRPDHLVWAYSKVFVRSLFGYGYDKVILDATSITPERRAFWQPDSTDSYHVKMVWFAVSAKTCIERAGDDEELIEVIRGMSTSIVRPNSKEFEGHTCNLAYEPPSPPDMGNCSVCNEPLNNVSPGFGIVDGRAMCSLCIEATGSKPEAIARSLT